MADEYADPQLRELAALLEDGFGRIEHTLDSMIERVGDKGLLGDLDRMTAHLDKLLAQAQKITDTTRKLGIYTSAEQVLPEEHYRWQPKRATVWYKR
jgi:hypothetical protein